MDGVCGCPDSWEHCDGECVDLGSSISDCGACGVMCGAGEACIGGSCECDSPTRRCDGACVDLDTDPDHCGACGVTCGAGEVCIAGSCECEAPTRRCDGACVDFEADPAHCGACGVTCGAGEVCLGGSCECASPTLRCDGACVSVDSDASHCGGCGVICLPGASCVAGACTCPAGYSSVEGRCVEIDECADPAACGRTLAGGEVNACMNTAGSYACTCGAGFGAAGAGLTASCADVDECADPAMCGRGLVGGEVNACTNTEGSYACACGPGFAGTGAGLTASCADVDECAIGADDCDRDPASCANGSGSFACVCPAGFAGSGVGPDGCIWDDPSLLSLVPSSGSLSPSFAPATTAYVLGGVAAGAWSVELTATVAQPGRATITMNGVVVASGIPARFRIDIAPQVVVVAVVTESGAMRAYGVVIPARPFHYVKASNTGAGDGFGAVALSADGSTLAVGAPSEASAATGIDGDQSSEAALWSGAVYVFRRSGATWTQEAYIKASNTELLDEFGTTIALSADGSTLAVGAPNEDSAATGVNVDQTSNAAADSGAVYVFRRSGTVWTQEAYVKASNTEAGDHFGTALALSADGSTLAVGALDEDSAATGVNGAQADDRALYSGAVYVFRWSGTSWAQEAYVKASNTDAYDQFGSSIALSSNGSTMAVAAPTEASAATGVGGDETSNALPGSGAVYSFRRSGAVWSQEAYIKASNSGSTDRFGGAVALSADGSTLAIGAHGEASVATGVGGSGADSARDSGAVYVFRRSTTWAEEAYIKASNTGAGDRFGRRLAISADGSVLAVGAPNEDSAARGVGGAQASDSMRDSGAVYVFRRAGAWGQDAYVKASNSEPGDLFGLSLALSADGSLLAVGGQREDSAATGLDGDQSSNAASNSGAVYLY